MRLRTGPSRDVGYGNALEQFGRHEIGNYDKAYTGEHKGRWCYETEPASGGSEGECHCHSQCNQ